MSKNILVNYLGRQGGGNLYAYEMTKGLINNGANIYAIISAQNMMLEQWKELQLKKLIIVPTYENKFTFIFSTIKLILFKKKFFDTYLKNIQIDAIYVPMFHFWNNFINKMFPYARKIITDHDPLPHSGNILNTKFIWLCNKQNLKTADDIIILSEKFKDVVINLYKKKSSSVHVIPHGVFSFYKVVQKEKNTIYDKNKTNFLFFGRIEKYKGLHILSQAFKIINEKYPNTSLTIAGNGDFKEYEKEYAQLKNTIIINRWIKDEEVNKFFQGENIITVLPYIDATQSGVISIAMVNKSLVIASDVGGLVEQVKDKYTGIIIKHNDVTSLVQAMELAILDKNKCNKYIINAEKEINNLSWNKLSKILLTIINKS